MIHKSNNFHDGFYCWFSIGSGFMMEEDDREPEGEGVPKLVFEATHEAKLGELLHKINSIEIKLCSDGTKEFIKLLNGNGGGELLHLYVQTSLDFSELLGAWKLQEGKPALPYILSLISVILSHPNGKYKPNDKEQVAFSGVLDKLARSLVEEKLEAIYKELNSNEEKCQNAALLLMASIVRRGPGLASEVAKNFNFKIQGFSKLAGYNQRQNDKKRKNSTRKAFVGFAMSFLEEGKPGLLRWVLQQKEMYSGVLRGLGNDDDETVDYVLSTLRDRVLSAQSLVPPGLRSVLFGSATLEQLAGISGRESGGAVAELAHNVLVMVCTDPCNGLMPDLKRHPNPLRGNPKRLLGIMKKLRATESGYHRDLLLDIVRGRPFFGSAYMEEFPYNLEDYASPSWFATVSLAANLLSSVSAGLPFTFLDSQIHDPPSFDSVDVQNILNCISPRPFSRSVINKGLLHADFLVKNGTLKLLLEVLKLWDSFFITMKLSCSRKQSMQRWASLKQEIQNEVRTLFPDPQVMLSLLSSLSRRTKINDSCLKRTADTEKFPLDNCKPLKKLKTKNIREDTDIILGGISSVLETDLPRNSENDTDMETPDRLESGKDFMNFILELWGSDLCSVPISKPEDVEIFFHSKVLDALKIYLLTMPSALDGSFDFFMNLLSSPLALPTNLQCSLLSLLVEYIRLSPSGGISTPPMMYKHLQPFINFLIFSPIGDIKEKAHDLAQAAMSSTGAFDRNLHEIVAWFLFLPGYTIVESSVEVQGIDVLQGLSRVVISFLSDAISTIGNNLFRYWDILRDHTYHMKEYKDVSPEFSPLIPCVLQKCVRLLNSESGTFSLTEKTMISVYVCNTLKHLLQTQVHPRLLSAVIRSILTEGLQNCCSLVDDSVDLFCEWRPLKNLLQFAESILQKQNCCSFSTDQKVFPTDGSFARTLSEVRKIVGSAHDSEIAGITKAFSSAIICTSSDEILKNFPHVMTISEKLWAPVSFLSSIIFLEQSFLSGVVKLWPEVFFSGVEMALSGINFQGSIDNNFAEETIPNMDLDICESAAAAAFGLFLRQAPFHVLFPPIMSIDVRFLLEPSKLKDLLLARLSEWTSDCIIPYLRLLLFWFYQIQSSYRIQPSAELEQLVEICYILVKQVLTHKLVLKPDSKCSTNARIGLSAKNIQAAAETIFCHPAVITSLASPLSCNEDFGGNFESTLETFLSSAQERVHKIDHHVLDMLTTTLDYLSPFSGQECILEIDGNKQVVKAFKKLVQRLYLELRDKFNLCIRTEDLLALLPPFYALHALIRFISPFELFELVHWIFGRVNVNGSTGQIPCRVCALSVGFCIAGDAFKMLSTYLQHSVIKGAPFPILSEMEEKKFDIIIIEEIYVKLCLFATNFELDFAYICLLEAINAVYRQKYMQHNVLHSLSLVLSRVIMSTPIDIVSHCIFRTSRIKAKLLSLLVEISPLHLSVFGNLFLGLKRDFCIRGKVMEETSALVLSDEEFMMLIPGALSYLNSIFMKLEKQHFQKFTNMSYFYSKIILNGFRHWRSFVSRHVFQENYDEFMPSSVEELVNLVEGSLLGKTIRMLQLHFALNGDMKIKERLKVFNSIFSCSAAHDELLDCDVCEMEFYPLTRTLNLINRVVAKISFCRILLFPRNNQTLSLPNEADGDLKEISVELDSDKESQSRIQFVNNLVGTWQCLVKKFPSVLDGSGKEKCFDCLQMYRYLELFILRAVLELTTNMQHGLIQLQPIPFLEKLMRSSLLHRFEDPTTLRIVRDILTLLSGGKFSCSLYLQLLLAHSQFAPAIHSVAKSFSFQTGLFFRPMSGILRSLGIPHPSCKNNLQTTELYLKQLEIIKLLRFLLQLKFRQSGPNSVKDIGINLKELHMLLLSSYGATLSEIDLEIYGLMLVIECIDKSALENFGELDYLWGGTASKIKKDKDLYLYSSNVMTDKEAVEEHRRHQFRENLPVDPKICATTVVHFPYDRTVSDGPLSLNGLLPDNLKDKSEMHVPVVERYDPVFILRFSIHSLSMGYIEPVEFAALGLLAVAFVSMSSPDIGMRKLGYESLGRFKNALEKCKKKKDIIRLRLLLTYVQNAIEEPWQRIPSIVALFAAESSFILLDASHDHYTILSEHLMRSPRVNMKCIPLFHTSFQSNSVNFRTDRLWILRLVYAGLNSDDDAQILIRNSIMETLFSFYVCPLSDNESKELILQILKKSVKLHKMARYLVENCGLFPWLSSIHSIFSEVLNDNEKSFFSLQLGAIMEVVTAIVSSRNIVEWLQDRALEQLIEVASLLYKLLVDGLQSIKENVTLVNSVLQILIATLKISQKRKIYQPHFTLSFEGLFQIYQAFDGCNPARSGANAEFGLKAMLMSMPSVDIFHMRGEKLSSFLMWAVSTALKSDGGQIFHIKEHHVSFTTVSKEVPCEESLISKLLRWLVASVILGKLSWKLDGEYAEFSQRSSSKTLQSFLEYLEKCHGGSNKVRSDCEEVLAAMIFYLQQLLGLNSPVLPSVVSALCLLLLCDTDTTKHSDSILGSRGNVVSLWSKIRYPTEANPAWRWSFYQPWKDLSSELNELKKMDENHACQTLMVIISNVLGNKTLDTRVLSHQDVENSGVFKWERSLIGTE